MLLEGTQEIYNGNEKDITFDLYSTDFHRFMFVERLLLDFEKKIHVNSHKPHVLLNVPQ